MIRSDLRRARRTYLPYGGRPHVRDRGLTLSLPSPLSRDWLLPEPLPTAVCEIFILFFLFFFMVTGFHARRASRRRRCVRGAAFDIAIVCIFYYYLLLLSAWNSGTTRAHTGSVGYGRVYSYVELAE